MHKFLTIAAIFGLLAVVLGAFGAHGLEQTLSPQALKRYHTGVEYQFYHVGALITISLLGLQHDNFPKILTISGIAFILGIVLFSGSLYLYAVTGIKQFGFITPFGGLAFLVGWVMLIIYSLKEVLNNPPHPY